MVTQQELTYRQLITLRDGARVLLRPLTKDDRQALIDEIRQALEMLVRSYDPCISCSTHALNVIFV